MSSKSSTTSPLDFTEEIRIAREIRKSLQAIRRKQKRTASTPRGAGGCLCFFAALNVNRPPSSVIMIINDSQVKAFPFLRSEQVIEV
jgi:hypothetical protein